jgi:hypothetical protein
MRFHDLLLFAVLNLGNPELPHPLGRKNEAKTVIAGRNILGLVVRPEEKIHHRATEAHRE